MPSTGNEYLDLLLEDLLIILMKGQRNRTLNIFQAFTKNEQKKRLLKFLKEHKEFTKIYKSHSFAEYLAKTKLPKDFQKDDMSVIDIINSDMDTVHIGEPLPEYDWYKPPMQRDAYEIKPSDFQNKLHNLYKYIKENGSEGSLKNQIERGQIYVRNEKPNFVWKFDPFKQEMFDLCNRDNECVPCSSFRQFVTSQFYEMTIILDKTHIKHLIRMMWAQQMVAIQVTLGKNSKDAKGDPTLRPMYITFQKLNKDRITPTKWNIEACENKQPKEMIDVYNSRNQMYHTSGSYGCNFAHGGSSNDECKSCILMGGHVPNPYFAELGLQVRGVYTCKSASVCYVFIHKKD